VSAQKRPDRNKALWRLEIRQDEKKIAPIRLSLTPLCWDLKGISGIGSGGKPARREPKSPVR
jgi:hypothetical protein